MSRQNRKHRFNTEVNFEKEAITLYKLVKAERLFAKLAVRLHLTSKSEFRLSSQDPIMVTGITSRL